MQRHARHTGHTQSRNSPTLASFVFTSLMQAGRHIGHSAFQTFATWLFPPQCVTCGQVDALFCGKCIADIDTNIDTTIDVLAIDLATSVGVHTAPLSKAIHALKYDQLPAIGVPLGKLLATHLRQLNWTFDLLIPVPLHSTRLQERGYNQANILAEVAGACLECSTLLSALERTRPTESQVGKTSAQRLQNVEDAFSVSPPHHAAIHGNTVVLIDDVWTTGATLSACAIALRRAGAGKILAATVSRASTPNNDSDALR